MMQDKFLSVNTGLVEKNHLYVVDDDTWYFLDYDLKSDTYRIIADIQPDMETRLCWTQGILHIGEEFFIVIRNQDILINVTEDGKVTYYGNTKEHGGDDDLRHMDGFLVDDKLYIFPGSVKGKIEVFDLERRQYIENIPINEIIDKHHQISDQDILTSYLYSETDNMVSFGIKGTNIFFTLDLKSMCLQQKLTMKDMQIETVGGEFLRPLLLEKDSYRILVYDRKRNDCKMIDVGRLPDNLNWTGYKKSFWIDEKLAVMPPALDCIELPEENGEIREILPLPSKSELVYEVRLYYGKFSKVIFDDKKIYLLPFSTNGMVEIDKTSLDMDFHPLKISEPDISVNVIRRITYTMRENEEIELKKFVQAMIAPF